MGLKPLAWRKTPGTNAMDANAMGSVQMQWAKSGDGWMIASQEIIIYPMRKRKEFISMRSGKFRHSSSFVLQMRKNSIDGKIGKGLRVGFTVTKKIGNAVERNRIKRRMRVAARHVLATNGRVAHDYVMIGKRAALNGKFEFILAELRSSLSRLHREIT